MTTTLRAPTGQDAAPAAGPEPHAGFRAAQRLAYECALAIEATLAPGVTEREVATSMARWLLERGVDDWFHRPFAWFGERTAFRGLRSPLSFFPSDRRLEAGMPFILDVAPVLDGHAADIGYAGCLGRNALLERMQQDLADHRATILASVRAGKPMREVYADVDRLLLRQGYDNRHREYPGRVLAHRVSTLQGAFAGRTLLGFGLRGVVSLGREALRGRGRPGGSPLWGPATEGPPAPGLWAVEPHLGLRGVGCKFEELLVVTETDARWLDDDVPHVRRWRSS